MLNLVNVPALLVEAGSSRISGPYHPVLELRPVLIPEIVLPRVASWSHKETMVAWITRME